MGRKSDLKEVDRAMREAGIPLSQRPDFSRYLHKCKQTGDRGSKNDRGDYTYEELLEKAEEFKQGGR